MQEALTTLYSSIKLERKRHQVAEFTRTKLLEMSRDIPYFEHNNDHIKSNMIDGIYTLISISTGFIFYRKAVFFLFHMCAAGFIHSITIRPYFLANIIEEIAEYPTDYGQATRAILIFKFNEGPKTAHYEELSNKYRKYLKLKELGH